MSPPVLSIAPGLWSRVIGRAQAGGVHPRQPLSPELLRLADRQHGVLTTGQLREGGTTERAQRRMARTWTRLGRGTYCLGPVTWDALVIAGLLVAGAGACVGGLSAAWLHGLVGRQPRVVTIWRPSSNLPPPLSGAGLTVRFRSGARAARGNPPRTGVEQTILDAAHEADEITMVELVTRALARKLTTSTRLGNALATRTRQRHRRLLAQLCDPGSAGVESALEWLYLHRVERAHGLPPLVRQVALVSGTRSDGWYPEHGVVIELDGRTHDDVSRDLDRDNRHALALNAVTLRYGWWDTLQRPCAVARQVHAALMARGHVRPLRRCPACPPAVT